MMLRFVVALAAAFIPLIEAQCPGVAQEVTFVGACTFENIQNQTGCDLTSLVGSVGDIIEACNAAAFNFSSITDETRNFDSTYFNGGGPFNNDRESDGGNKEQALSANRLFRVRDNIISSRRILMPEYDSLINFTYISHFGEDSILANEIDQETLDEYPPYLSQFNLTSSCKMNSIMCCFVDDRLDTELEDNADVCTHDLKNSAKSNNVQGGFGVYDSNLPAYCTAFKWDDDENSDSYQYRGNALFDVSFGTFLEKGYVKNIPGAPLCSCLENMPVVTNAACRTLTVTDEKYTLTYTGSGVDITQENVAVTYEDCGENFKDFHLETDMEDATSEISKHIVESCVDTQMDYLNDHFLIPVVTDQFTTPARTEWQHVAGWGLGYYPTKTHNVTLRDPEFRSFFEQSPNKIVYRHCHLCRESHQHIYYRRLTDVPPPEKMNFIDLFLSNWFSKDNTMHVDFELFSTYEDALNMTNAWEFCNYDDAKVGFPRDCGPKVFTACQWNSYEKGPCGPEDYRSTNHAFYIEREVSTAEVQ